MNILYVSSLCSVGKNKSLVEAYKVDTGQQAQKLHNLLSQGIVAQKGEKVNALTALPINRRLTKQIIFKKECEISNGISYIYTFFINLPVLRQLSLSGSIFINTFKWISTQKDERIIICDVLNFSALLGCLLAAKMKKCKVIGIVSDLPTFRVRSLKLTGVKRLLAITFNRLNLFLAKKCDAFVLITKEMSKIVNPQNKPFIVMEGLVDINMTDKENILSQKYEKKVCHYAGGLLKIYGLEDLVQAFIKVNLPDAELHIYGGGPYEEELKNIVIQHDRIKFFGYVSNDIIVQEQLKSTLLINPRPTNEEYTKYSFPSKNMEYMVSGTPVLTTKLPGMPKEYEEYVYLIEDESENGIKECLIDILSKSAEELYSKGKKAKKFVLTEKNNVVQGEKILKICSHLMGLVD